jgi:hypothetical protein
LSVRFVPSHGFLSRSECLFLFVTLVRCDLVRFLRPVKSFSQDLFQPLSSLAKFLFLVSFWVEIFPFFNSAAGLFSHHQEHLVPQLARRSMRPGESAPSQIRRKVAPACCFSIALVRCLILSVSAKSLFFLCSCSVPVIVLVRRCSAGSARAHVHKSLLGSVPARVPGAQSRLQFVRSWVRTPASSPVAGACLSVPLACASFLLLGSPAVRFGLIASGAHPGPLLPSVLVVLQFCPGNEKNPARVHKL